MLTSLALIFLCGMLLGGLFQKIKLPSLLGMLITGIALSPYAFNLLDDSILNISSDLRRLALVIILTRAGLSLNIDDLKKVGRPALLLTFVPACFEIIGIVLIAPFLFGISILDAAIMGSVVAAVSPAVIVPRMIHMIEEKYGTKKQIPQMILAGASVDDVFVIVLFTAFVGMAQGGTMSASQFLKVPVSIVTGILLGFITGWVLSLIFKKMHIRDSAKVLVILSISFLLLELETRIEDVLPLSGLLAIMSMGIMVAKSYGILAVRLSAKYNKLWVAAEVLLFVLVGATVDLSYALDAGLLAICVVIVGLIFRMTGVIVSLIKTKLNRKERSFCMVAYTPKATVQAAIGAIPLSMGLSSGKLILTVAVLSILITAPFGAICVDRLYEKWLTRG